MIEDLNGNMHGQNVHENESEERKIGTEWKEKMV